MKRLTLLALIPLAFITLHIGYVFLNSSGLLPRHMGKVESLHNPITISGWTPAGLTTADGRTLPIPGIQNLPATSPALSEATKRGIELDPTGRVTGLVRVYHWCGNDPISAEILRIDLSDMLIYLRVGEPTAPVPHPESIEPDAANFNDDSGWNVSNYFSFKMWQSDQEFVP